LVDSDFIILYNPSRGKRIHWEKRRIHLIVYRRIALGCIRVHTCKSIDVFTAAGKYYKSEEGDSQHTKYRPALFQEDNRVVLMKHVSHNKCKKKGANYSKEEHHYTDYVCKYLRDKTLNYTSKS